MKPLAMENDSARPDIDVVDSSLEMTRDASAYEGGISHKYGQVHDCPTRNPKSLSLTKLEFNEAMRLDRAVLLFIIGEDDLIEGRRRTGPHKDGEVGGVQRTGQAVPSRITGRWSSSSRIRRAVVEIVIVAVAGAERPKGRGARIVMAEGG